MILNFIMIGSTSVVARLGRAERNVYYCHLQQHVNQDTNWDIPSSPEPMKMDGSGPSPWKPTVNNGTDLWEANLRNGGQPPPQPQQKTPWGHTPSTNIGGTWGEDDDTDTSNVWTGVPSGQQQWGGNTNNGAMWGGEFADFSTTDFGVEVYFICMAFKWVFFMGCVCCPVFQFFGRFFITLNSEMIYSNVVDIIVYVLI